ncbi:hypothetical protein [Fimbriimonas ginsengisoli]|uniref:Uncharacterized protein n=1 Tax=Fimbriimonas ginsengisoli Gsoil 348 TaxID=661478 RepID=A0A068NM95_FIMGI|nr:hypothetical protein [Fimbriimonas ginsengisoli]AIE84688.1 hypothetical protein OP10G_1320 [Fimbriimonas ginsengisoli Gsoil 348]
MLKNQSTVVCKETGTEWRIERRTRGQDRDGGPGGKPIQTWVFVLTNKLGHRRFVAQERMAEFFGTEEAAVAAPAADSSE